MDLYGPKVEAASTRISTGWPQTATAASPNMQATALTARFGANENPLADGVPSGSGSDRSPDGVPSGPGGVAPDSATPHPRSTSIGGACFSLPDLGRREAAPGEPHADAGKLKHAPPTAQLSERAQRIAGALHQMGASFFAPLHQASGGGFPGD